MIGRTRSRPPLTPPVFRRTSPGQDTSSRCVPAQAASWSAGPDRGSRRSRRPRRAYPAGVICEIVNDDGTMARVPDLFRFCETHGLVMVTVADLARYRLESEYEGSLWAIDASFLCV